MAGPKPTTPTETLFADRFDAAAAEAGEPPPEVKAEVRAAVRAADRMQEMGRQLRFEPDAEHGGVRIELRDLEGNVLRAVPPAEVFDFASGRTVE